MFLNAELVPFWTLASPAANGWYTYPVVGSATIGPIELLKVELPVVLPCPGIGLATLLHVLPSSVERQTLISVLFTESWYERYAVVPIVVIHSRSAPAVSSTFEVHCDLLVAVAGQRVTDTPSWKLLKIGSKMKSRSASRIVPAEVTSTSASPSPM